MNNKISVKTLKTAVTISRTLEFLCTFSTAVTAVAAIWSICSAAKRIYG